MNTRKSILISLLLIFLISTGGATFATAEVAIVDVTVSAATDKFLRTELFFGRSKPDGSIVTDEEWNKFLNEVVTPRFPDGFTVLDGIGQYRDRSGKIIVERSKVLVILYSAKMRKESRRKIEEVRAAYIKQFDQESVLRMDLPNSVRVLF